jgi:hypothetical protein
MLPLQICGGDHRENTDPYPLLHGLLLRHQPPTKGSRLKDILDD